MTIVESAGHKAKMGLISVEGYYAISPGYYAAYPVTYESRVFNVLSSPYLSKMYLNSNFAPMIPGRLLFRGRQLSK